ncbi:cytidylate kinase family protein [archaeon]|nr:cytidylate kinase family protein [archaeon]
MAGSGKSTQVDLLGKHFKLKVIHSSRLFREFNSLDTKTKGWWEKEQAREFTKKRFNDLNIDKAFDHHLMKLARKESSIADSWTLPWLLKESEVCSIYLLASQEARAKRIAGRDKIPVEQALKAVRQRDDENIKLYFNLYNYRIDLDLQKFNLVLKTDNLSIKQINEVLKAFIKSYFKMK